LAIRLKVNDQWHSIDVKDNKFLLWALRENLGVLGPKFGCGKGLCGSCTVLFDGQPLRSCITLARSLDGKEITTIEGVGSPSDLHPVQQAWLDIDVPQCGYCQGGQILHAISLLEKIPDPNEDEIDAHMGNLICRCGTYARIKKAIQLAAKRMNQHSPEVEVKQ